ncbi:DUF1471 domain-containing protein [Serratia aquatilis]|uniref:DUF1471 domain-containing protein n=1 Tax=Serratia aquatilis TaxID=1737515 RepID=A0ABV6EE98_9GAMM
MKKMPLKIATTAFAALAFSALAATTEPQVTHQPMMSLSSSVTVSGLATLAEVEESIAAQAKAMNASRYRIIAVTGNNKLHASAVIYR